VAKHGGTTRRAALLGAGRIALGPGSRSHLAAYRACRDVELVAACDPDPQALERAASEGLRVYRDAETLLLEERPAIVSVCSPPDSHVELVLLALKHGAQGVLLEKPVAPSVSAAQRLQTALRTESAAAVSVNYSRRFAPAMVRLQHAIASGVFGRPRLVRGLYSKGLLANGSHWLDLARWLVGEFTVRRASHRVDDERDEDPTLDVDLSFAGGAEGQLRGADHRTCDHFELDLLCDNGRVRLLAFGDVIETSAVVPSEQDSGYRQMRVTSTEPDVLRDVTAHALRDLLEAIDHKRAPRCTIADGLAAMAAVEDAARLAVRSHG
jgi:predicted dehydrogenase